MSILQWTDSGQSAIQHCHGPRVFRARSMS